MKERTQLLNTAAAVALFTVGNSLIRYPWNEQSSKTLLLSVLLLLAALLPSLVLYPVLTGFYHTVLSRKKWMHILSVFLSAAFAGCALYLAYQTTRDYLTFATTLILPKAVWIPLAFFFLLCAKRLSSISQKSMERFCLIAFCGVAFSVVLLALFGVPRFRPRNLRLEVQSLPQGIPHQFSKEVGHTILQMTLPAVCFSLSPHGKRGKGLVVGTVLGYVILLVCVLQVLLTFGGEFASQLQYPYSFSVRIVSIGPYFLRLEGLSYLLDYSTCLVKTAVCFAVVKALFKRHLPGYSRFLPACAELLLMIPLCLF